MASIGDLVANLTVNSSGWSRGLSSAASEVKGFASRAGSLLGSPAAAFRGVGAAALYAASSVAAMIDSLKEAAVIGSSIAAGGAIVALTSAIKSLAETADTAARTSLSGRFLQRLGYAADQAGVDNDTLTKSLSKMTLVMGEAKNGNEAARKAFDRLGLSVTDLQDLSPEQQFSRIANALGGVTDTAQRASAAVDIFGKSGAELGPLFQQGAGGIVGVMEQAASLGIGLSDEDIAKAAAADDAMQRMGATIAAVAQSIAAKLSPVWEGFANTVTTVSAVVGAVLNSMATGLDGVATFAASAFEEIASLAVTAISILEFAFTNWAEIAALAFTTAHLKMLEFTGSISHFFSQVIPGYLSWFGNNWRDVFYTAFDFVSTGFINLGENIRNAWSAILAFITGDSDSLALVWKPLTDGFVSTVKELPDIPERAISDIESQLVKETDNLGKNLGNSLTGTIEKNLAMLPKIQSALKMESPTAAALEPVDVTNTGAEQKSTKTLAGAMERGSADAYSAIVQAMTRGPDKVQQDQLAELKKLNANIKKTGIAQASPAVVESLV